MGLTKFIDKRGKIRPNGFPHLLTLIGVQKRFDTSLTTKKWSSLYNELAELKGYLRDESWTRSNGARKEITFKRKDLKSLADKLYNWSKES
jgi:hypothetical protein